jgi:HEAT repeat protein
MAEIHDPHTPALLLQALHDPEPDVRHCAALALRKQPAPEAVADLAACLPSADRLLAHLAADALIAAGKAAVPALLEVMQTGPQAARLEAVRALAGIGDTSTVPALFAALDEESALMEYWAGEGLERMGVGMAFFKP